ncbi:hypothetical protein BJP25_28745 [Actinokineospora bangkokensis]|uniref:Uncharacterized protein n=1 Tax=Actinokineospora bangkokensis TaxID=1193682 RepID=A0A1Q9LF15_9PSEU|nr:hypothetical protein BJP25_28745 [Actinokineospora bangkokensis]
MAVLSVLGSVALGAYLVVVAHGHPAAALPAVAFLVGVLVLVLSGSGHVLPDRVALGLVLVSASVAVTAELFFLGGRTLRPLLAVVLMLLATAVLLVGSAVRPGGSPVLAAALPPVAAVAAGAVAPWRLVATGGEPGALVHGSLLLIAVAVFLAGRRAEGPGRFAVGALVCAVAVAVVYFLAVSGGGVVPVALGAVVVVALIGSLPAANSTEPTGSDRPVR